MVFITEPLDILLSGRITEQIGRRRSLLMAAIPAIASWTMFYFAQSTELLFELKDMATLISQVNACSTCQRDNNKLSGECTHTIGYLEKVKELLRTKSLRPIGLLMFCMIIIQSRDMERFVHSLCKFLKHFALPLIPVGHR